MLVVPVPYVPTKAVKLGLDHAVHGPAVLGSLGILLLSPILHQLHQRSTGINNSRFCLFVFLALHVLQKLFITGDTGRYASVFCSYPGDTVIGIKQKRFWSREGQRCLSESRLTADNDHKFLVAEI